MFCDKKKCNKCGLHTQLTMENRMTGKVENYNMCTFTAILESLLRSEQGDIRIQKAIEESRNEKANSDHKTAHTVAVGMLGLIHAVSDNEKAGQAIRNLGKIANAMEDKLVIENKGDAD